MNRVLVTGGSGFVGANLVRRLHAEGHEVHLLIRSGFRSWRLEDLLSSMHLHSVAEDRSVATIVRDVSPIWIFNLAAYGAYPSQTDVDRMLKTNVGLTIDLLSAAMAEGVEAFVQAGSSSEYGFKDHAPIESEVLEPNSAYGVTKAAASMYCAMIGRRDSVNVKVLRLYSVYGPWEEPTRFVPQILVHALNGVWPPLASPATARDFVYVDDVVDALMTAAAAPGAADVFNVGSGTQSTLKDVVELACAMTKIQAVPQWMTMPSRGWDTDCWISNSGRIREVLGWSATTSLPEGLERTVEWMRSLEETHRERYLRSIGPGS